MTLPPMTYSRAVEILSVGKDSEWPEVYADEHYAKAFLSGWDARRLEDAEIADGCYELGIEFHAKEEILNHQPAPMEK